MHVLRKLKLLKNFQKWYEECAQQKPDTPLLCQEAPKAWRGSLLGRPGPRTSSRYDAIHTSCREQLFESVAAPLQAGQLPLQGLRQQRT